MKRFFLLLTITAMSSIACLTAQNIPERFAGISVSYTHLTLPTIGG